MLTLGLEHDESSMEFLGIDPPKSKKRKKRGKDYGEMDQACSGGAHINRMLKTYTLETFPKAIPVPPAPVSSSGEYNKRSS